MKKKINLKRKETVEYIYDNKERVSKITSTKGYKEVCDAFDGLNGKACEKIYFYYIGHGGKGYMVLKKEDKNRTDELTYEKLACKLLELDAPEVCITIEACNSGSAIKPIKEKEIEAG